MKTFTWKVWTLLGLSFALLNSIEAQQFVWAKKGGQWAYDYGYGTCVDNSGNIYVAGKYEMDGQFDGMSVSAKGNHDMFLAKYDNSGKIQWLRSAGSEWGDYAHEVDCDGSGNVFVTGEFELTADFGSQSVSTWGGNDIFLARYNTRGDLQWVKRAGGGGDDQGLDVYVGNNAVYVSGKFKETGDFDGTQLTSKGDDDVFVAKYDYNGNLLWARRGGGPGEDEGYGIIADASGNVYVTGWFAGTADFGSTTLTSRGMQDIFVVKYDPNGNLIWAKRAGGEFNDCGTKLAINNNGKLIATGRFRVNSDFGSISLWAILGNSDIYIAQYNPSNGEAEWVEKAGGEVNDYSNSVVVDQSSNIYITGYFGKKAEFGNVEVNSPDTSDIYVASYGANGSFRWVKTVEGIRDTAFLDGTWEAGHDLAVDNSGSVIVTGAFRTDADFGQTHLNGWANTDVFVAKLSTTTQVGLAETNKPDNSFTVYPNPASNQFTIELDATASGPGNVSLEIINMMGQTLFSANKQISAGIYKDQVELTSSIPAGIYTVRVICENRVFNTMLRIER